jgi:hypothetical protein
MNLVFFTECDKCPLVSNARIIKDPGQMTYIKGQFPAERYVEVEELPDCPPHFWLPDGAGGIRVMSNNERIEQDDHHKDHGVCNEIRVSKNEVLIPVEKKSFDWKRLIPFMVGAAVAALIYFKMRGL